MRNDFWAIITLCFLFIFILGPLLGYIWADQYSPQALRELANMHYDRGRQYFRSEEYEKAQAEFEQVLSHQPKHQGALWYLEITQKELAKEEQTFRGYLEKLKENISFRKKEELKTRNRIISQALNVIERRSQKETAPAKEEPAPIAPQEAQKATQLLDGTTAELIEQKEQQDDLREILELYEKGKAYLQDGLYSEAAACFDKVIELGGDPQK